MVHSSSFLVISPSSFPIIFSCFNLLFIPLLPFDGGGGGCHAGRGSRVLKGEEGEVTTIEVN